MTLLLLLACEAPWYEGSWTQEGIVQDGEFRASPPRALILEEGSCSHDGEPWPCTLTELDDDTVRMDFEAWGRSNSWTMKRDEAGRLLYEGPSRVYVFQR